MTESPPSPTNLEQIFAAHRAPDREVQEADRALQRGVVCLAVAAVWIFQFLTGRPVHADAWFIFVVALLLPMISLVYGRYVLAHPGWGRSFVYAFLVVDPLVLVGLLIQDPETFAFLNPFLLVTVVRVGIRYGVSTFYLSWLVTLCASALLASSAFWRHQTELAFAFLLMLLCLPLFFSSLIRRIHNV